MAADALLTAKVLEIPEGDEDVNQIFTDPSFIQFLNDSDTPQPGPIEIGDEHSQTHLSHREFLRKCAVDFANWETRICVK